MSTNISKFGCVTSATAKDAGFVDVSDLIEVGSIEDCLAKADNYGNLCAEKDTSNKDKKCHFFAYKDGSHNDLLQEASAEYEKKKYNNNYVQSSLLLFHDIWLSYSISERKDQLDGNQPFLSNFAPWVKESKEYMKWFYDNLSSDIKPIPPKKQKNKCWIGGNNVLKNKEYTHFIDNSDNITNKKTQCKDKDYGLYIVPGTEGDNYNERIIKMFTQQAIDDKKQADEASKKARSSLAMAKVVSNTKMDTPVYGFINRINLEKKKTEFEEETKDTIDNIGKNLFKIIQSDTYIKKIKDLSNISTKALNNNIDFVKDKQHVSDKIEADLQTLTWSLTESENKELLQNKITTTLGIIIMLFSGLCVGLIVYYLIGGIPGTPFSIKNKSNKNVLNNIFGFNKSSATSSNKKALNSLFS